MLVSKHGPAHHGDVGTGQATGFRSGFLLCLLIPLLGAAGCAYEYTEPVETMARSEPVHRPTAGPVLETGGAQPYSDPEVLKREAENYAELYRLLRAVPGSVLLFDVGPLDGPVRGFGKTERVISPGQYTVTAACVGAPGAVVAVGQEHPGAPFHPIEIPLNCTGATTQVVALQQGYIFAHLVLPGPGDTPWTGAVGGVRITAAG